jgi:2-phosphoglycerate kinase
MAPELKVILIGGTSHAGKSTTARLLADSLGWDYQSTDKLARHPGRPWNTSDFTVPEHVADHYGELSVEDLIADVLRHYQQNVVPQVEKLIHARTSDSSGRGLVIEGSALYPDFIAPLIHGHVAAFWLTAPDDLLARRIRAESGFTERSPAEQFLIDKFTQRTLAFSRRMDAAVQQYGLPRISITQTDLPADIVQRILQLIAKK